MKDADQLYLVQRIQAGEAAAETELFKRYQTPILWKICRHLKADRENVKDVASEVYLAILQGLRNANFQPERWESLEAYIWGVTNNKIRDWFKQANRNHRFIEPQPPAENTAVAAEEFLADNDELRRHLQDCLQTLDSKYRIALELRYFRELTIPEMSAELGISPRRVSERIHYALKLLRKAHGQKLKKMSIFILVLLF
ncbi:sigma-70 family RNA polymerase sigma factor [bacterium]|nr:sigma-70 family RNA polymerase sigma factor [bacterium]RIK72932.1 MAG: hypothetical protein DCC62_18555 [candidate division KSB1 bacterium]